ncbi:MULTISPECIES: heme biosynthesis HemY N-terminal domain-containing protein [Methylomonas]|uniref:Heme biosynthesis protein HemY n=2 Tax=Methylomonas TaxID=416 RepID=A0A126T2T7_9GAMM|nr:MULTISPECIES: heme biosynthesis HemY N-terminal domain-containing protein [Methylomonas]AMK76400.1 heme biosynthesis protein HemY [Methylomonas denitrificans]OAH98660.1 heme biosynthesis protein HemY [Methylomonas methanica]TCV88429.1 HemY protein [Methylomonas methanica]
MKNLMYFLGSLLCAVLVAFLLHSWLVKQNDPGYVLIGFGHWSLETSLTVFAVAQVIGFFLLYNFFRLMGVLIRMPNQFAKRRRNIRFNRSHEALVAGLFDAADGNWERAEKVLIKHAAHSGAPLLHYLTAARAAQSRGALDKRDEYLQKASEQSPDTNMTVGLTQAELHLSEKQFEQALETLGKLHSINPGHARVLKMMHQAYQHLGDWEGLSKLLPTLQQHKVLMETEVKLLETETFSRLLKQTIAQGDRQAIQTCWEGIPEHIKTLPGIANIYFAAMIAAGAGASVESAMLKQLGRHWDDTLLVLVSNIETEDKAKQLQSIEQWLAVYPSNAVLLRVLGKLALKAAQMEKAEQYLLKSLNTEASVATYQLLGELLFTKGDKDQACDYFKRGMELASAELISGVEEIRAV